GRNISTYDLRLKPETDTTPKIDSASLAGVNFPRFNLVSATWGNNAIGWRTVQRHPAKLTSITVEKASGPAQLNDEAALCATPLADIRALNADVVFHDDASGKVAGHLHANFQNGQFAWQLTWEREDGKANRRNPAGTDVQELGWVFTAPAGEDHFSWHRKA